MASKGLYKRWNVWWIRYAGVDGRTRRETTQTTNHREAQALLIKRKQGILDGKEPEVKRIKSYCFFELKEEYLKWAERQKSYKSKKGFVEQLCNEFGNLSLRNFGTRLIDQFVTKKLDKGNKPATVNRHLATIKHMFSKAVEWEMVEEETLKRIRRVKLLKENNKRSRFLSSEEGQILIDCAEPHLKPILITALNTGMRKTEILTLKWENIDLRNGCILLHNTKNDERRDIPINENMRKVLKKLPRRLDVNYLFFDPVSGKRYIDVKRSFKTACRRAKINDFRFHDLRHTFASHLVMAGVDIMTVKELLGHKSLSMTLRYAHLAQSHKTKAVQLLDFKDENQTYCTITAQSVAPPIKKTPGKMLSA
jgi:integrase